MTQQPVGSGVDHRARVLRAGVIGGGWGGRLSMDALQASSRLRLVAAADLREAVREDVARRCPGVKTFGDHVDLLADSPDLDVLCVSTFPPSHEEVTLAALSAGHLSGLLVEKPLGHTAASGRRILDAVRTAGLPMAVPHNLVTSATGRAVRTAVADGAVGRVMGIDIAHRGWDLINAGIHWLQFALTLLDDQQATRVQAAADRSTRTFRDGMQVETAMVTSVEMSGGARVVLHTGDDTSTMGPAEVDYRIVGTAGTVLFHGWEVGYELLRPDTPAERRVPPPLEVDGHQAHLERLADHIDAGTTDYTVAETSWSALEVIEAAYLSAAEGRRVTLPLTEFVASGLTAWSPGHPYDGSGGGRDGRTL